MQLNGNKTNLGIILIVAGSVLARVMPEYADVAEVLTDLGYGLTGIGLVHKYEKSKKVENDA